MKILIICSKKFYSKIEEVKNTLEKKNIEVFLPNCYDDPTTEQRMWDLGKEEHQKFKAKMYKQSEDTISKMDAVLVLNLDKEKDGSLYKNYIGGATFLEMYDAFRLNKKIYLYNDIPKGMLYDEIEGFNSDVLEMDIRLGGTYGFYEARKFAYGSTGEFTGSSGEDVPIQFAIVGNNQPVGILGLWKHYDNSMFREVWGSNEEEPETQPICFISDEEAKKINQFKLYYFKPTHSFGKKQYAVEKQDRMFDRGFDFVMSDGTDYRLQEVQNKQEKVKELTKQPNDNQ